MTNEHLFNDDTKSPLERELMARQRDIDDAEKDARRKLVIFVESLFSVAGYQMAYGAVERTRNLLTGDTSRKFRDSYVEITISNPAYFSVTTTPLERAGSPKLQEVADACGVSISVEWSDGPNPPIPVLCV